MLNYFRISLVLFCIGLIYLLLLQRPNRKYNNSNEGDRVRRSAVRPISQYCQEAGQIALTFDGGPSGSLTQAVLDALEKAKVSATFHVTMDTAETPSSGSDQGSLLSSIVAKGHLLGLLWPSSRNLSTMSESQIRDTLRLQSALVHKQVGQHPKFLRFPVEFITQKLAEVAHSEGFVVTLYNLDGGSGVVAGPGGETFTHVAEQFVAQTKPTNGKLGRFIARFLENDPALQDGTVIARITVALHTAGYAWVSLDACVKEKERYRAVNGDLSEEAKRRLMNPASTAGIAGAPMSNGTSTEQPSPSPANPTPFIPFDFDGEDSEDYADLDDEQDLDLVVGSRSSGNDRQRVVIPSKFLDLDEDE